jgi:hypothetical protein
VSPTSSPASLHHRFAFAILLLSVLDPDAAAQRFSSASIAAGAGSIVDHCSDCSGFRPDKMSTVSLSASGEMSISKHVRLGASLLRNRGSEPNRARQLVFVGAYAGAQPSFLPAAMIYAGPGFQWFLEDGLDLDSRTRARGPALIAGLLYRISVARHVAVMPYVESVFSAYSRSTLNGVRSGRLAPRLLHAGLRVGIEP